MTPYTSIAIRIVRFPLAVLVVFIHSVGPTDNIAYYPFRDFFLIHFVVLLYLLFSSYLGSCFFSGWRMGLRKRSILRS